jgi:hypothetical protein
MAGGRGALCREDVQSYVGWTVSEVDVWCSVCMHGYSTMVAALAASLTRAAGWHLRAVRGGLYRQGGEPQVPDQRRQRQWSDR